MARAFDEIGVLLYYIQKKKNMFIFMPQDFTEKEELKKFTAAAKKDMEYWEMTFEKFRQFAEPLDKKSNVHYAYKMSQNATMYSYNITYNLEPKIKEIEDEEDFKYVKDIVTDTENGKLFEGEDEQ